MHPHKLLNLKPNILILGQIGIMVETVILSKHHYKHPLITNSNSLNFVDDYIPELVKTSFSEQLMLSSWQEFIPDDSLILIEVQNTR